MTTFFELKTTARQNATRRLPAPETLIPAETRRLAEAVQAAVASVEDSTLKPVAPPDGGPTVRPKLLLALLSFCYARQTYSSTDVAAWVRREMHPRHFGQSEFPDAQTLSRFRRENRAALHHCLQTTLRFLLEQKVAAGLVTKWSEAQLAEEASRRIIMAMFTDSLELEADSPPDAQVDLCYLFANRRALAH
jgi:transposase